MATSKRMSDPEGPDLTSQSDFQLLNSLAELTSKERSQPLQRVAWEIMRRYTAHLQASEKPVPKDYNATLGEARWGDARRVDAIFGIKRGVLHDLSDEDLIKNASLNKDNIKKGMAKSTRAKRLYCLVSIADYIEKCVIVKNSNAQE